ncbi:MAG: chemotaxis protein CheW [Phycisphaerales bacterium]|nr:chemotaxis protein CheW [Phycisphaerales bacterium]
MRPKTGRPLVSSLIGQQEVVIKPLDSLTGSRGSLVSGATVRDDGGVSLIVDVRHVVQLAAKMTN